MTPLSDIYTANIRPGTAFKDHLSRPHYDVPKDYSKMRCSKCGGLTETTHMRWESRDTRVCKHCDYMAGNFAKGTQQWSATD